jgi:hypothetical protein
MNWLGIRPNLPKPGYGQLQPLKIHYPMDWWGIHPNQPNPGYGQLQPAELNQPMIWIGGVQLVVTDHIQG